MSHLKKVSSALSIATTILLQACSGGGGGGGGSSAPDPVANIKAPLLIGGWGTGCITTAAGTSTSTGSSGSGGGGISGGEAFIDTVIFNQNGRVQFTTERFSTSNCNTNTFSGMNQYDAVYFIGEASFAGDGSEVVTIDYSDSSSTTYSIYQIVNGLNLYIGNKEASAVTSNGDSTVTRFDELGPRFLKK